MTDTMGGPHGNLGTRRIDAGRGYGAVSIARKERRHG